MNKGFFYYLRRSWSITSFAYKRLSFMKKLEVTLFLLVCYIGSFIFFLRPIFSIALSNAARMIEESHNLSISKCFEGITKNERYKELLVAQIYVLFLILVVAGLCFIPNLSYMMHPSDIGDVSKYIMWSTIGISGLFFLITEIKYLPLAFVASGTINTSAGDMLLNVRNIRRGAVWTEMITMLFFVIIALALPALCGVGIYFVNESLLPEADTWFWLILGLYILAPITLFFPASFLITTMNVALYELYKDTIALKKIYVVKEIAGTEVKYASVFPTDQDEVELIKEEKIGGLK